MAFVAPTAGRGYYWPALAPMVLTRQFTAWRNQASHHIYTTYMVHLLELHLCLLAIAQMYLHWQRLRLPKYTNLFPTKSAAQLWSCPVTKYNPATACRHSKYPQLQWQCWGTVAGTLLLIPFSMGCLPSPVLDAINGSSWIQRHGINPLASYWWASFLEDHPIKQLGSTVALENRFVINH